MAAPLAGLDEATVRVKVCTAAMVTFAVAVLASENVAVKVKTLPSENCELLKSAAKILTVLPLFSATLTESSAALMRLLSIADATPKVQLPVDPKVSQAPPALLP